MDAGDGPFWSLATVLQALFMLCDLPPLRCCSAIKRGLYSQNFYGTQHALLGLKSVPVGA